MNRHIRLQDCQGMPVRSGTTTFLAGHLAEAREALEKIGLRYDNATGIMRDNRGIREKLCDSRAHVPHKTLDEVMYWEFSRYIRNAASRLARGYSAV